MQLAYEVSLPVGERHVLQFLAVDMTIPLEDTALLDTIAVDLQSCDLLLILPEEDEAGEGLEEARRVEEAAEGSVNRRLHGYNTTGINQSELWDSFRRVGRSPLDTIRRGHVHAICPKLSLRPQESSAPERFE